MNTYYRYNFLFQTFVDVDSLLSHLTEWISSNKYLEIGDDPNLVNDIESELVKIQSKVKSLEPYFDLANTPLSKANIYFLLIKNVAETVQFVQEVQKKDYGSQHHTSELLARLKACLKSIDAISEMAMTESSIVQ